MKNLLCLLIAFLTFTIGLFSQTPDSLLISNRKFYNSLGVSASFTSGYGFTYNRAISEALSFQVTGFYWLDKESGTYQSDNKSTSYNIGLEIHNDLYRVNMSRVYFYAGAMYYYSSETRTNSYYVFEPPHYVLNENKETDEMYSIGAGLGLEYALFGRVAMNLSFGVRYYNSKENSYNYFNKIEAVYPSIGSGIFFKF